MLNTLINYDLSTVVIITVCLVAVIAGIITWTIKFTRTLKELNTEKAKKALDDKHFHDRIDNIESDNAIQNELLQSHEEKLNLLLESDRSRIKGEILKQYQYFKAKGGIDALSLEYLHQQFDIYQRENGNSWVEELMEKVDNLDMIDL